MTNNEQLELGFNGTINRSSRCRRETRVARAQWWFAQMRAVVADAMEWPANGQAPAQRIEQIVFPGGNRRAKV